MCCAIIVNRLVIWPLSGRRVSPAKAKLSAATTPISPANVKCFTFARSDKKVQI